MAYEKQLRIIPSFKGVKEGAICFESGASPKEAHNLNAYLFEHHGSEYHPVFSVSALRALHERMLLGQDMPSTLILTRWWRIDQVLSAVLFMQPSILLEPACTHLVQSFDLVERLGPCALAHVYWEHRDLVRLVRMVTQARDTSTVTVEEALALVVQASEHILLYLTEGTLPLEPSMPVVQALATGEGFVAFTCDQWAWDVVWASGAIWGVWFGTHRTEIRIKSRLVFYNKKALQARLNDEFVFEDSSSPGWVCKKAMTPPEQEAFLKVLTQV